MPEHYIGLISGTSVDAVDAVLLAFGDDGWPTILATHAEPPPPALRNDLLRLAEHDGAISPRGFGEIDRRTGEWFGDAVASLLGQAGMEPASVRAIGSHGQTLYHAAEGPHPFSLQIGDPNLIAARTGIATVADFRRADMAAGGQGAPLVPAFHRAMFASDGEARCAVNLGGMANVTVLPPTASGSAVTGFDTGPGNALMDDWIHACRGEMQDTDGRWAASAAPDQRLLARLLDCDYFRLPPPKSTGRETFNLQWIRDRLDDTGDPAPARVQRTLLELTAHTVADAIETHAGDARHVLLCGGGVHNPLLRDRLAALLAPRTVETTDAFGIGADWVEAAAFAWLAMRTLAGLPGNLPAVTGAARPVVLGGIYEPRGQAGRRPINPGQATGNDT